ncbi:unnamed protein product [Phyllotreta striolata]|uniref:Uncharacterized protein n=1 Tax=Phyllotreta striolata TaxID=444603 RepID=A0A9N9XM60_PHYSR|nr:unnamed protein product [Phyllotreta striolata]
MALFELICSLMIIFVHAGRIPSIQPTLTQNTFYTAINNTCTNASELMKQENEVFKNCINLAEITKTAQLTSNNTQNVKCLLYYDRIMAYCKSNTSQIHYPTLEETSTSYNLSEICQGVANYSKNLFKPDGISPYRCILLCGNLDEKFAPECLLAHYYHTRLNPTSDKQPVIQPITQQMNEPSNEKPVPDTKPKMAVTPDPPKPEANTDDDTKEKPKTLNESVAPKKPENEIKPLVAVEPAKQSEPSEPDKEPKEPIPEEPTNKADVPIKPALTVPTTKAPVQEPPEVSIDKQKPPPLEPDNEMEEQGNLNYNNPDDDTIPLDNQQQPPAEEEFVIVEKEKPMPDKKPDTLQENPINVENAEEIDGESYFMSYFMVVCVLVVLGYVGYHNRVKVMALMLEGKRNRRQYRGRRPNSANYHKLDSNLEEAISSNVTKTSTNVIY